MNIDLKKIIQSKLSLYQVLILQCIADKHQENYNYVIEYVGMPSIKQSIVTLQTEGWLKIMSLEYSDINSFEIRQRYIEVFGKVVDEGNLNDWLDEWRRLFPIHKKGDRNGCFEKMKQFLKKYPKTTKEEILQATNNYLNKTDFQYIMEAHYFVEKNKLSKLAAEIELLRDTGETVGSPKGEINEMV